MKIGIIIYSQTGHTLSVAQRIQEVLVKEQHEVTIDTITVAGETAPGKFDFSSQPAVEDYEALILGSPVQGFSLSSPMEIYLTQLPSLEGKKTVLFVTKQLPFAWTGGNRSLGKMKEICEEKGALIMNSCIAYWSPSKREASIEKCVNDVSGAFL